MEINNVEQIKKLMNFTSTNEFYFVQIIHRSKDGLTKFDTGKTNFSNKTIKSYFVSSPEYLDQKMEEIIELCKIFNARAYINLNKKSYKQVGLKGLENLAHMISLEEYKGIKTIFESACGQTGACDKNKTWLVDIDTKDENEIEKIKSVIEKCEPDYEKVVDLIPTVHGYHLITKPFNKKTFRDNYQEAIDIHDNNPTLLYVYKSE
jgi:hypothetical protein